MKDFLTFEYFITPNILILFYYVGVFILPLFLWIYREKVKIFFQTESEKRVLLFLFLLFLMMQLIWRVMFEFMIGYFDMHNYLHIISQKMS